MKPYINLKVSHMLGMGSTIKPHSDSMSFAVKVHHTIQLYMQIAFLCGVYKLTVIYAGLSDLCCTILFQVIGGATPCESGPLIEPAGQ